MSEWTLIDCMLMVSDEADLPRSTVESEEQLRAKLNGYRLRSPASIVQLVSPQGDILQMGIGSEFSGLQWIREPLNPAKKQMNIAVADRLYSESGVGFRFQGSESGFRPKYVIPVETTIDAAVHFFKTGQLPNWLQWAEWNSKTRRLEVHGSLDAQIQTGGTEGEQS